MGELFTTLRENGDVIAQAPWAALIWAIVIGALMFAVVRALKAHQIGNLVSRLHLRDDEIANYRRKLEVATPDEAAAKIAALEQAIARMQPKNFTAEQLQTFGEGLRAARGRVSVLYDMAYGDGRRLAQQLGGAIAQAGWEVSHGTAGGLNAKSRTGLLVSVGPADGRSAADEAIIRALTLSGIEFDISTTTRPGDEVDMLLMQPDDWLTGDPKSVGGGR